jgi:hemolysin III
VLEPLKPLLRGWSHTIGAVASTAFTVALLIATSVDIPRMVSMLVFGLSMVQLYTISAIYHLGRWRTRVRRVLRALDHSNIFVLIAGTYTPLCFNVLDGWLRILTLAGIWLLAVAGVIVSVFNLSLPRWASAALYIGMGWLSLLVLPALWAALSWPPVAIMLLGGVLYTVGAIIYASKRPNPFPRVFGFHEIFHLFVIAGSIAFAVVVWVWALPFPRS